MEEEVETVTDILFLGSKITVSSECSHEIKRRLPWKHYDKPRQHIKNQRHYFADKSLYSQSYGFSSSHVWMWDLNHKEAECWRTDTFEFVMWEKILESPLDYKEINQLIQKQISPEYSLEGLLLKLKLQYFGHLMQKADSLEKSLMLGKIEGKGEGDDRRWNG